MPRFHAPLAAPSPPSLELVHALAWFAREVLALDRLFNTVTVKRRRNLARPVKRRKSAFRDPMICLDLCTMTWLGVTRLSHIETHLRPRQDLARAFGLPRFCDHTTAHNFLNAFHRTHVRQLDDVNARLLIAHGQALSERAPILDLDLATRSVRHVARRRRSERYRWAVAFCAGEAIAQRLALERAGAEVLPGLVLDLAAAARRRLARKPRLVRLAGTCASAQVVRALARERLPFLTTTTWAWALAQGPERHGPVRWAAPDPEHRVLDLGAAAGLAGVRQPLRVVLVERAALAPGLRRDRFAIVTSLADEPPASLLPMALYQSTIRGFFGHPRWPLGDGKLPSSGPRGIEAYLHLATIARNVLGLFARHLAEEWSLSRLRDRLRVAPAPLGAAAPRG